MTCVAHARIYVPDHVDALFAAEVVDSRRAPLTEELVQNLITAFVQTLVESSQLSEAGRKAIIAKYSAIVVRIGKADNPVVITSFPHAHWENVLAARANVWALLVARASMSLTDMRRTTPFLGSTHEINAYYRADDNTVSIYAGILQPPFFDSRFILASLYGGIGTIIGHELAHAVDAYGRLFDGSGRIIPWIPAVDVSTLQSFDKCLAALYDAVAPETGETVHGVLTVGEDFADQVGERVAYLALQTASSQDLSPQEQQAFFSFFAQVWAVRQSAAAERAQDRSDPHALASVRVNRATANDPVWRDLYRCPPLPRTCAVPL